MLLPIQIPVVGSSRQQAPIVSDYDLYGLTVFHYLSVFGDRLIHGLIFCIYVHSMGTTLPRVCEELLVTTCNVT